MGADVITRAMSSVGATAKFMISVKAWTRAQARFSACASVRIKIKARLHHDLGLWLDLLLMLGLG